MFWFRKNFENVWKSVRLENEEIAKSERNTLKYGFRAYNLILKMEEETKVKLEPVVRAAMLIVFALKFESFANDIIESNAVKEAQERQKHSPETASAPQS